MNLFRRLFSQEKEGDTAVTTELIKVDKQADIVTAPANYGNLYGDRANRPLPEDALIAFMGNGHLTFGQATDIGLVRNNNQDSVFSLFSTNRSVDERPDFGLFLVADGMGGHHDGEKASAITAHTVALQVMTTIFTPLLTGDSTNQP